MKTNFNTFAGSLIGSALALALAPTVLASPATDTATYNPSLIIPDNDLNGVANMENLASSIQSITDVTVSLNISGGYDGDIYAYLSHGATGFAVLLNRTGVTAGSAYGSSDSGFNVTLNDAAATDIHNAPTTGGVLTGTFQPDGRAVSPLNSLDTTPRTAFLSSFDGMSAAGGWTLFLADASPVGIGTLDSWTLTVSGTSSSVPDSGSTLALFGLSAGVLLAWNRCQVRSKA